MKTVEDLLDYEMLAELSVDQSKKYIAGVTALVAVQERQAQEEQQLMRQAERVIGLAVKLELRKIAASHPRYLRLADPCVSLEAHPLFAWACHYGRLWYRSAQYTVNEQTLETVRRCVHYSRQAVFDFIDRTVRIADVQLHVAIPLAYRVGVVVGWLSALSVVQPDDAQARMVMLQALVSPLVSAASAADLEGKHKRLASRGKRSARK